MQSVFYMWSLDKRVLLQKDWRKTSTFPKIYKLNINWISKMHAYYVVWIYNLIVSKILPYIEL